METKQIQAVTSVKLPGESLCVVFISSSEKKLKGVSEMGWRSLVRVQGWKFARV